MILILIQDEEVRTFEAKDLADAQYRFERCIEKEGFQADEVFLVEESSRLPVQKWIEEAERKKQQYLAAIRDQDDRRTYERLKQKFEGPK